MHTPIKQYESPAKSINGQPYMTLNQARADECASNQRKEYICFDCADKYSNNPPYADPLTVHISTCYICQELKPVAPSYKLMGFYKRIF